MGSASPKKRLDIAPSVGVLAVNAGDIPAEIHMRPQPTTKVTAGGVVLSGDEATALRDAYRLLRLIADRLPETADTAA